MSAFDVTPAQLKSTADQLESLNQQFQSAVNNLDSTQQTLNGMWEGEAKQAFQQAFSKDKVNMDAFHANITKFVAAIRTMASKYEQAENQNTQTGQSRSY
ncbi:MAG: WXG100 family type VII secretion target [Clostridia bacterium]|nr:WXG100 family type VII secretion target [Clostridia bacterium]